MTLISSRRVTGAFVFTLAGLLAACGSTGSSGNIATVNGQAISRADFEHRLEASPIAKKVLGQMIQSNLLDQYAKDNKIDISDSDVDKKLDELKSKYPSGQFDQLLASQGMTTDEVRHILRQQLVIEKAVGAKINVTDKEVSEYFNKNSAQFDKPETVHARHILVADLKTANDVEDQLKKGAKFEDLAKKYSTDPASKEKGGDLGFFHAHEMVPAFEQAAFAQPLNAVGAPVKSPFGYHIIQVLERKPAVKATLANSSDTIKKQLRDQQIAAQLQPFLASLQSTAKIDISDPKFKDVAAPAPVQGK